MDVSVQQLRDDTGRVIAAVERGELVVLTDQGKPVADIISRHAGRSTDLLLAELAAIAELAGELGVISDRDDFDSGLTTDGTVSP